LKKQKKDDKNHLSSRILNDVSQIKKIDRSGMLSYCLQAPSQYIEAQNLLREFSIDYPKPESIIIGGMGGSAIGGEILKDWCRDRISVPIGISRQYSLPKYANRKTLVLILSYSGETEEALSMFWDATKRNCMILCISSNGFLLKSASRRGLPFIKVPSGIPQPRAAFPFLFLPLIILLERIDLISNVEQETQEAIQILNRLKAENAMDIPFHRNYAKKLASSINHTIPVIYGFGIYRGATIRFKQELNENSKIPARYEFFPELNHNEIVSWDTEKRFLENMTAILIRDKNEPEEMRLRIKTTKDLIEKRGVSTREIWSSGDGDLAKMLSIVYIGDLTSIYLAILRGVDPASIVTIDQLKKEIKKSGFRKRILDELM
jgi:glucose/mannose-6-phosphate isomerase